MRIVIVTGLSGAGKSTALRALEDHGYYCVDNVPLPLVGQMIDVAIFQRIRAATGERYVWLRATGSTAVSQLVDSFIVLYIAFVIGPQHWPMGLFLAVGTVNYCYKLLMAFLLIPLIYLVRRLIYAYLGEKTAAAMEDAARQV